MTIHQHDCTQRCVLALFGRERIVRGKDVSPANTNHSFCVSNESSWFTGRTYVSSVYVWNRDWYHIRRNLICSRKRERESERSRSFAILHWWACVPAESDPWLTKFLASLLMHQKTRTVLYDSVPTFSSVASVAYGYNASSHSNDNYKLMQGTRQRWKQDSGCNNPKALDEYIY